MRILHYTLGFPPYRSGGLVKYAKDLMQAQCSLGHKVTALYPSSISLFYKKCHIKKENQKANISVYEMVNPMPVPLLYGIKDPTDMMDENSLDEDSFEELLMTEKPDIFHVHTLMGLPRKYLQIVHDRHIRIVYTSHDYFGICLKVNFIDSNGIFCNSICAEKCYQCNKDGKPTWFFKIRNAKCLVPLKSLARKLKK